MWERILRGLETVKDQYPEVRPIFTGVSSLKTMARLRQIFPWCCFCNSVCQYLAQRHVRLRREGVRPVPTPLFGSEGGVSDGSAHHNLGRFLGDIYSYNLLSASR